MTKEIDDETEAREEEERLRSWATRRTVTVMGVSPFCTRLPESNPGATVAARNVAPAGSFPALASCTPARSDGVVRFRPRTFAFAGAIAKMPPIQWGGGGCDGHGSTSRNRSSSGRG